MKPWIIEAKEAARSAGTHRQTPEELDAFKQFSMCINCMLCYAACPVVANEPDFLGPAAIALGHRYNLDSRDDGAAERNEMFRERRRRVRLLLRQRVHARCARSTSTRATAIQQAKLLNVIDWAKGFVVPRRGKAR